MEDNNITYEYIVRYLRRTLAPQQGKLAEMELGAREKDIPIAQIEVIRLLQTMVASTGAKRILEIGTAVGYSTISMLQAAGEDGSIVTIEKNAEMAAIARENCKGYNIEVLTGDAVTVLEGLSGTYDMVFIDAAKAQYRAMLMHSLRLVKEGGLIISDNVLYKGMIATDDLRIRREITIIKRMRNYLDYICNHPNLMTSIIPIGDGIAMSVKIGGLP